MVIQFSKIDYDSRPILILKRADGTPIGVLGNATEIELEPKYNELSILTFKLPHMVDGEETPFYEDVTGQKIIELKGIGQFVVANPQSGGSAVTMAKSISAQSLEAEFARKCITLPESTYRFFDLASPENTLLGMVMELMPNWSIGNVSDSLVNKYRTFDVNNENLYNFIKGTVQKAYNCIFEFDTLNRRVNVRDADEEPAQKQVFISRRNLAKDISVTENTDDMVTRLDVSGADGVDIREVNPIGTNYILNLDYFMDGGCFSQALTEKYNAWKQLIEDNRVTFYNYAIEYAALLAEETAENAKLTDLRGEYTSLENIQATIIQGIASNIRDQDDLDEINEDLADKQDEIDEKIAEIEDITEERIAAMESMTDIRDACAYELYFTEAERRIMDSYIFDNSVEETSFVASEVTAYTDGIGNRLDSGSAEITGSEIADTTTASGATIYTAKGGSFALGQIISAPLISAVVDHRQNGKVIMSAYLAGGTYNGASFPTACVTVSGQGSVSADSTSIEFDITDAYLYFTLNASDYEKKTVSFELYEYGKELLRKMSVPSYTFSVDSANFIRLADFAQFKRELELGQRIYIEVSDGHILRPICTGAKVRYYDRPFLDLQFSDTFTATDSSSKLVEILENSVSMGKTLSAGKFTYEAFTGSGASNELMQFITSALDTAKNAIISSTDQAVSWDGAGLRLRKYTDAAHAGYDPEQIWVNNNSIVMTENAWATAKMAIGKFYDENLGNCWGIVAPMIVGTMVAGNELVIESSKKDGGTAVFRMDENGCALFNTDFSIQKTNGNGTTTQILENPDVGIVIGTYPVLDQNGDLDQNNAKFWADDSGTLHLAGSIIASDGLIANWSIGTDSLHSGSGGSYVALASSGTYRMWAGNETASNAPFSVQGDGTMTAKLGTIGGWYIGQDYIGNANTKAGSSAGMASGIASTNLAFWAGKTANDIQFSVTTGGSLTAKDADISGTITSGDGSIGGWTIKDNYIGSGATKNASLLGFAPVTGTNIAIWAGNTGNTPTTANFRVTGAGAVYATDMHITGGDISIYNGTTRTFYVSNIGSVSAASIDITGGTITIKDAGVTKFSVSNAGYMTSVSGKIGGWDIGTTGITSNSGKTGIRDSTNNNVYAFWAGNAAPGSANFYVKHDGYLYATSGKFGGALDAATGTFNGTLQANALSSISISTSQITSGTISANMISGGSISASLISGGTLSANLVRGGILSGTEININEKFKVNSSGDVTANSITLKGELLDGTYGTIEGWNFRHEMGYMYSGSGSTTFGLVGNATATDTQMGQTGARNGLQKTAMWVGSASPPWYNSPNFNLPNFAVLRDGTAYIKELYVYNLYPHFVYSSDALGSVTRSGTRNTFVKAQFAYFNGNKFGWSSDGTIPVN